VPAGISFPYSVRTNRPELSTDVRDSAVMCPRSVALPRFSRSHHTHSEREAKRSNFSYSDCCTTGHRPPHIITSLLHFAFHPRYHPYHLPPRYSINPHRDINTTTPLCRHAIQVSSLTQKLDQPQIDFQRVSYIFSEPRADSHSALQEIRRAQARPTTTSSRNPLSLSRLA